MDSARRRSPDGEATRDTSSLTSHKHGHVTSHRNTAPHVGSPQTTKSINASTIQHPHERMLGPEPTDHRTRAAYAVFEAWATNFGSNDPTLSQLRAFSTLTALSVEQVATFFDNEGIERYSTNPVSTGGWPQPLSTASAPLPSFSEFQGIVSQSLPPGLSRAPQDAATFPVARVLPDNNRPPRTALPDSRDPRTVAPSLHTINRSTVHEDQQFLDSENTLQRSVVSTLAAPPKRFLPSGHIGQMNDAGFSNHQNIQESARIVSVYHPATHAPINVRAVFDTGTKRNFVTADFLAENRIESSALPDRDKLNYTEFGMDLQPKRYVSLDCGDPIGQILKPQRLTFNVAEGSWSDFLKASSVFIILGSEWIKEQQTNVFSIVSGKEVGEPRAKRTKFSEEERQEVAKTRKVGACEECRRSKRKVIDTDSIYC